MGRCGSLALVCSTLRRRELGLPILLTGDANISLFNYDQFETTCGHTSENGVIGTATTGDSRPAGKWEHSRPFQVVMRLLLDKVE